MQPAEKDRAGQQKSYLHKDGFRHSVGGSTLDTTGGDGDAGIASTDGTITINGGTVNAIGGAGGNGGNCYGMGGGNGGDGGDGGAGIFNANGIITINGGTVNVIGGVGGNGGLYYGVDGGDGGDGGAGIASADGAITINGGTVNATGGAGGAGGVADNGGAGGDGSTGIFSTNGTITINSGIVNATGGVGGEGGGRFGGAGIDGAGIDGAFSTGTEGTALIMASSIRDNEDTSKWGGIIFEEEEGRVYGDQALRNDFEIPGNHTLTIPADTTLTVPENATLTINGTLINDGTFVNDGEVINNGTLINNGEITDIGAIKGNGTIDDSGNQPSGDPVSYWTCDQSGQNWKLDERRKYIVVEADTTTWGVGFKQERWYVVNSNVVISDRITVSGDVHLILADGCTLTAKNGIQVEGSDSSLTIYAQSLKDDTMGRLSASISNGYTAAIGSGGGVITINGGAIDARGGYRSAGIGGGQNSSGGIITINGGKVIATGGDYSGAGGYVLEGGAGIGSGRKASGGIITINGGDVTATGNGGGAGIGGGGSGTGGTITITGGTVNATGSRGGAGIGDGNNSSGGTFSTGKSGNAFIMASSISDQSDKDSWSGVIFAGNDGKVYGAPILKTDATIPSGKKLEIPAGKALTIDNGVTLTNNGTIIGSGTLDGEGNLEGSGTIEQTVINKLQKDSAVSVSVSPSNAAYGSTVTITATMSRATNIFTRATTNQVEFFIGTESLGTANVVNNTATLSDVEISKENGFVTGENTITAEYGGSMGLKSQSGTAILTISKAEQTAFQIANVTGKKYGDAPFTLTTTGGNGTGTVTFSVLSNNGVLTVSGKQATIIGAGTVTVTANKAGDDNYNPVTASSEITIGKAGALTLTNEAAMIKNHTGFTTKIDLTQTNGYPKVPGGTPTFTVPSTGYNALTSASVDKSGILTLVSNANSSHQSDTVPRLCSPWGLGNSA